MRNNALIIVLMLFSHGCIVWDAGYTDNGSIIKHAVPDSGKVPISYHISLDLDMPGIDAAPEAKELMQKIEAAMRESNLFSEISYEENGGKDSYHVEFMFHQSGMSMEDQMGAALLCGSTFMLAPVAVILTFDGNAVLSLKGAPIYSTAKAEEVRSLMWLPMAPFGLFLNPWVAWHYAEKGTVNALVNDIVDFHKGRFLNDVDVKVIKE